MCGLRLVGGRVGARGVRRRLSGGGPCPAGRAGRLDDLPRPNRRARGGVGGGAGLACGGLRRVGRRSGLGGGVAGLLRVLGALRGRGESLRRSGPRLLRVAQPLGLDGLVAGGPGCPLVAPRLLVRLGGHTLLGLCLGPLLRRRGRGRLGLRPLGRRGPLLRLGAQPRLGGDLALLFGARPCDGGQFLLPLGDTRCSAATFAWRCASTRASRVFCACAQAAFSAASASILACRALAAAVAAICACRAAAAAS
ncbi:hypothetical protein SCALM49S_04811 [Streptomyces californicus]